MVISNLVPVLKCFRLENNDLTDYAEGASTYSHLIGGVMHQVQIAKLG